MARRLTSAEKWDRKAQRWNEREAAKYPLLAAGGLVRQVTGADLEARKRNITAAFDRMFEERAARQARQLGDYKATARSAGLTAALEGRIDAHIARVYPTTDKGYAVDCWCSIVRLLEEPERWRGAYYYMLDLIFPIVGEV